jgi:hypothetical protein
VVYVEIQLCYSSNPCLHVKGLSICSIIKQKKLYGVRTTKCRSTYPLKVFKPCVVDYFIGFALKGRDYGMIVATSFGLSDTLFNFQLINSKHKLLKFEIVMNNSQN